MIQVSRAFRRIVEPTTNGLRSQLVTGALERRVSRSTDLRWCAWRRWISDRLGERVTPAPSDRFPAVHGGDRTRPRFRSFGALQSTLAIVDYVRLRSDAIDWREIEGEVVALDLNTANYLATNRSGALLWPELVKGTTREALVARLVEAFDVDPVAATSDVDAFLRMLAEQELLDAVP